MTTATPPPKPTLVATIINHDTLLSQKLYTLFNPILPHKLLKSLEISGDGKLFFPITLSLLLTLSPPPNLLINLLLAALLDLIIIGTLKQVIQRPRPVYNKNMFLSFAVDHWSFPSGHSSRVFMIATLFSVFMDEVKEIFGVGENGSLIGVGVWVWAGVTSVSRVLLGRHFVMDVFVGGLLGVLEGVVVFRVFNIENLTRLFVMYRSSS